MRVAIFTASGLGKAICEALELEGTHKILGFFDDTKKRKFCGYPILGKCYQYKDICKELKIGGVIVAFGYKFFNERFFYYKKITKEKKISLINAIHPKAIISPEAEIGRGIYIGPGVIINSGTKIGDNSVIWSGTIIEHDNVVRKNVFIAPGVKTAGYTQIGDGSFIGMGADITKVKIGKNVTVGAASLVLNDIKSNKYAFGIPAKVVKIKKKNTYV